MLPTAFAPSDVIHLCVWEIDLDLSVGVLEGAEAADNDDEGGGGHFQMRSSLTCLRVMMGRRKL